MITPGSGGIPSSASAPAAAPGGEDPDYATRQLITCLGNKRTLLSDIDAAVVDVKRRLGRDKLRILDAFSGSGAVSRVLKGHSSVLHAVDLEDYAACLARCYLRNRSDVDMDDLARRFDRLAREAETAAFPPGFIEELYAPRDEQAIAPEDRVFYTRANARRLDVYRRLVDRQPPGLRDLFLGPLLSEASIHANTAGVFKGFYKDRATGLGKFGGTHADALPRITGPVTLSPPLLSRFDCAVHVHRGDANLVAPGIAGLDLAYLDPPYNQHPYGANYFMLNLLVAYERPAAISPVSGIPADWRRSAYNTRRKAVETLADLVRRLDARYILASGNNEGFIGRDAMARLLGDFGRVEIRDIRYPAYRGSRNLRNRSAQVTEHLFLLEKTP